MTDKRTYVTCGWISVLIAMVTAFAVGTSVYRLTPLPFDAKLIRTETLIVQSPGSKDAILLSALAGGARMQFIDSKGQTRLTLVAETPSVELSHANGELAIRLQVLSGQSGARLTLGLQGAQPAWGVEVGPDGKPVLIDQSGAEASDSGSPDDPPEVEQTTDEDG